MNIPSLVVLSIIREDELNIQRGVDQLNAGREAEEARNEREQILNWLGSNDSRAQQANFTQKRQAGTGEWLIRSDDFQNWIADGSSKRVLFCPGVPGVGKTIISLKVISELSDRLESKQEYGIAYVFCDFRRREEREPESLMSSLLRQLLEG
jgi:Cdc6-like AAA superfamily ATPase